MVTANDVKPNDLIEKAAEKLKDNMEMPEWAHFVKTGVSRERAPENMDWWFIRSASIIRKLYLNGPIGVSKLRTVYGGRQRRGHKQAHFKKGSGKIVRTILKQLEKLGYIKTEKGKGRIITSKGRQFLDSTAKEVAG